MLKENHKSVETLQKGLAIDKDNAECIEELRKTNELIQTSSYTETKEESAERLKHAMADPEI